MLKFKTEKISERITRIFGFATELMYLVEGDNVAALIDTGSGVGSLKACVDELTDKPVIVLLTHGHVDHALGAPEFDEVYMNHVDDSLYRENSLYEKRDEWFPREVEGEAITRADYIPEKDPAEYHDLKGGDSFDLGGITIEIYDCPGHTHGSVVMLMKEERAVLLGDACNYFTFLFADYSTTVTEYEESLKKLKQELKGKFDKVYLSHADGEGHLEIIADVIKVCEDIKSGNVDDVPFGFMGNGGFIAKARDEEGNRLDGGKGNIIYSKDRI